MKILTFGSYELHVDLTPEGEQDLIEEIEKNYSIIKRMETVDLRHKDRITQNASNLNEMTQGSDISPKNQKDIKKSQDIKKGSNGSKERRMKK